VLDIRVWQRAEIYVKSHARRYFEPYFSPLICIDDESWFKMAARILQCKFHMLPDAYGVTPCRVNSTLGVLKNRLVYKQHQIRKWRTVHILYTAFSAIVYDTIVLQAKEGAFRHFLIWCPLPFGLLARLTKSL
jgi:hypothetical protein